MSFATTISALSSKVDGLIANRVAKFAYTQQAYNSDDVNGVENYDYAEEQNIPLGTTSVLKVNETILTKGWRTQASAITRMLMNHFLGRTSYNLNKTVDFLKSLMTAITDNMGVAEGFATLDANGRIPSGQLTEEVMEYKGEWNADTNTPELDEETGKKGDVYKVSVSGTQDLGEGEKYFRAGTYIIFNGTAYTVLSGEDVAKVNNIAPDSVGNVTLTGEDIATSNEDTLNLVEKFKQTLKSSFTWLLGRYWEEVTLPVTLSSNNSSFIVGGKFFISDYTQGILCSSDGKTWSTTNVSNENTIRAITYFKGVWVAIPYMQDLPVMYSSDGLTWVDTDLTGETSISFATNGDLLLICVYHKGVYATSNGKDWTCVYEDTSMYKPSIKYINNRFYTVNSSNVWIYSENGTTWNNTDLATGFYITYANGIWTITGGNIGIRYSTNGINWAISNVSSGDYHEVTYANGIFSTALTSNGAIKYSTDGATWTNSNVTTGSNTRTVFNNGVWVTTVRNGKVKYSYDAKTWTDSNTPTADFPNLPSYFNGVWFYTKRSDGIYYSFDAVSWTKISFATTPNFGSIHGTARTLLLMTYVSGVYTYYRSSVDTLIENGWLKLD